jgi:hypothetical protein
VPEAGKECAPCGGCQAGRAAGAYVAIREARTRNECECTIGDERPQRRKRAGEGLRGGASACPSAAEAGRFARGLSGPRQTRRTLPPELARTGAGDVGLGLSRAARLR